MTSSARPASGCSASSTARPGRATRRRRGSCTWSRTGTPPRTPRPGTPRCSTPAPPPRGGGGDLLKVFGDSPPLADPRHAQAYSPLWDAQLGLWTDKAVKAGLNTCQIDENVVFKLAAQPPTLLTGGNPATGQPQPYGSAGVDINCAPTANLAPPAPNSQFP